MGSAIETTKLQYSWILWYHDPNNKDYSLESYVKIVDVSTPQQFWSVVDVISKEAWESGMFFFMRRGFKPLWDVPENEAGEEDEEGRINMELPPPPPPPLPPEAAVAVESATSTGRTWKDTADGSARAESRRRLWLRTSSEARLTSRA